MVPVLRGGGVVSRASDLQWAETCSAGQYLTTYEDDGLDDVSDHGSRCGRDDAALDAIRRVLRGRGMQLVADDRGLCAAKDPWAKIDEEHDTWVDHVRNREHTP